MPQPSMPEDRPLHILHIIVGLGSGGAETALLRLVRESFCLGLRHTIVSLKPGGVLAEDLRQAGAEVVGLRGGSSLKRLWSMLRPGASRFGAPDVIQGWMLHGNMVAWMLRSFRYRRARLAWNLRMTLAGTFHERGRTMWLTRRIAPLSKGVDLLLANSETSMRDHFAIGYRPRRALVIPNGFDPTVFRTDTDDRARMRHQWRVTDDTVIFGLIGRFHRTKGHGIFINAASKILSDYPATRFVLVGQETDDSVELDRLLADHRVGDAFLRLGRRTDIPSIMRAIDVICVPSDYESFPNVLGEAMMTARPAIATEVSDVPVIMNGVGRTIPVGDDKALANAMAAMIDAGVEGRAAIGQAGRARMIEHYSLEANVRRYVEQYRLLSNARANAI